MKRLHPSESAIPLAPTIHDTAALRSDRKVYGLFLTLTRTVPGLKGRIVEGDPEDAISCATLVSDFIAATSAG